MAKKTLSKKEKVGMLADKLNEAVESCNFEATEELDLFAEAVALLIAYWGKVSDWTPIEKASYVGYVTTTVMEKGLDATIKDFNEYRKSLNTKFGELDKCYRINMSNPDKLYIPTPSRREGWMKRHSEKDVEYVRKDAFIEKAVEWLKGEGRLFKYMAFDNTPEGKDIYMTGDLYEDFRKAMMED